MTDIDLDAVEARYAEKKSAKELLTSKTVDGPVIGKLQIYAVVAAASADDVPALVAEVRRLRAIM